MKVSIRELAEEMAIQIEGFRSFADRRTGKILSVSEEALVRAEELDVEDSEYAGQDEELRSAFDVYANFEHYEELPDLFDIDEYGMMADFTYSRQDPCVGELLAAAIRGKGAFRRFKDTVQRVGVSEEWYRYRDESMRRKAIEWCEANGIAYEE